MICGKIEETLFEGPRFLINSLGVLFILLTSRLSFPNFYSALVKTYFLPRISFFTHSKFWEIYRDLSKGSPPKVFCPRPEDTLQKLKNLISHAYHEVPFYRERMQECGKTWGS